MKNGTVLGLIIAVAYVLISTFFSDDTATSVALGAIIGALLIGRDLK